MKQLDESQKHQIEGKGTDIRGCIVYDSVYKAFTKGQNYRWKTCTGYLGVGESWWQRLENAFWGDNSILYLEYVGPYTSLDVC